MPAISRSRGALLLLAMLAGASLSGLAVAAQPGPQQAEEADAEDRLSVTIYGTGAQEEAAQQEALPDAAEMAEGPRLEGVITSRSGDNLQVTLADGSNRTVAINDDTRISSSGGFLGLGRNRHLSDALLNGLPVSVRTLQSGDHLLASRISLKNRDLRTATMIHDATDQRFARQDAALAEHDVAIAEQAAATEALRGRFADLDKYNVKNTVNVNFDIGKAVLSEQAKSDLCTTASAAEEMDNALLLVVGYTDSTGSDELNQALSEKRAGSVVNYLQQKCGWKPYRMLTPTGMATADPLADNSTREGRAQNRRVAVNVLVSKAVDGI